MGVHGHMVVVGGMGGIRPVAVRARARGGCVVGIVVRYNPGGMLVGRLDRHVDRRGLRIMVVGVVASFLGLASKTEDRLNVLFGETEFPVEDLKELPLCFAHV